MASIISPIIGWILTISQYYFALCTLSFVVLTFSKTLRNFSDQFLPTINETGDQNQVIIGPITKKKNAQAASLNSAEIPSPDGTDGSPTKEVLSVIWQCTPEKKPRIRGLQILSPSTKNRRVTTSTNCLSTTQATTDLKTTSTKNIKADQYHFNPPTSLSKMQSVNDAYKLAILTYRADNHLPKGHPQRREQTHQPTHLESIIFLAIALSWGC